MKYDIPEDYDELKKMCRKLIDELNLTKSELARQKDDNDFLLSAIDYLPNASFIKDEDGCIVTMSKEYENIFGIDKNNFISKDARDLTFFPADERVQYRDEDEALLNTTDTIYKEVNFRFSDGSSHPCFYWSRGFIVEKTQQAGIIGQIVDITKERKMEQELREAKDRIEEASKIDPGTGLYNRYVFAEQTADLIKESRATGSSLSVMLADLDHFKRVNDTFGHLEGDRVLKDFATLLKSQIRSVDVPIRYGGEEFLVFLPDTDLHRAKLVAERIRKTCEDTMRLPDESIITVSIGLVKFNPGESRTDCINRADTALYEAKESGRNQIVAYANETEKYMG